MGLAEAIVLINANAGSKKEVIETLKDIPEVKEANSVNGVYDVIVRLEAETMEEIKNAISWGIKRLDRIKSTVTMLIV